MLSWTTLDFNNIHSIVHPKDKPFHGVRLPKKLWKCSQRGLKEDNPLGGVPFYESKLLVSYTRTCHDPIGHIRHTSTRQPLPPVPVAPQNIQKMRDWAQTTVARATPPSYLYQRLIQPGEPVSLERSDSEEQQENSGKQDEEQDGIFEYDFPSNDGDIPSLEREADFHLRRGSRCRRSIRFNSRIMFYLPCYGTVGLPSPFVFYAPVDIVIRFFDTDLSKPIEMALLGLGNRLRQNCMIGIRIGRYKPLGLRDWEKIWVGIAGLKNPIGDPHLYIIDENCSSRRAKHFPEKRLP